MEQIPGFPGYSITESGEIFNSDGQECVPYIESNGYLRITLGGTRKYVHQLVAITYVPNPDNLPEVNHDDGDKMNNFYKNLEWMTHADNVKHGHRTGLTNNVGSNHGMAKLTDEAVREIRIQLSTGKTQREIAYDFGISQQLVSKIKTKANWKHI